jgi:hypothetical protein
MDSEDSAGRPDSDEVHALLAAESRRAVLGQLASNGGSATAPELARRIAGGAGGTAGDERSARIRLHHTDLARLAEAGVVTIDGRRVELTPTGEWLERIDRQIQGLLEDDPTR